MDAQPILIVEDDPTIRTLVQQFLEEDGYETVTAQDGDDALRAVDALRPACILLDLNLPVLDGCGVLSELADRGEHVPVLMMTADPRGQRLGPADGVIGHVSKPFDLNDLLVAVRIALDAYSGRFSEARV